MRLVADSDLVAERRLQLPLRCAFGISGDRNIDLVDDRRNFGASLPEGLARFMRDQFGKFIFARTNNIGETTDRLDAVGDGAARPVRKGLAGDRNLVCGIARLAPPDLLAGGGLGRNQ